VTTKSGKRGPGPTSAPQRKKVLAVSIIGAGRLGLAIGTALREAGVAIDLVVTRSPSSARRAAKLLGAPAVPVGAKPWAKLPGNYLSLLQQTNLILIAAPDDFVSQISRQLAGVLNRSGRTRSQRRPVVVHTSGALTSRVLSPLQKLGVAVGSIHPLVSISSSRNHQPFASVYFSLEGDPAAVRLSKQLVRYLGGRSFVIQTPNKPLYHAAALMVSPNLTALIDIAIEMMGRAGIRSSQARRMLLPLIGSSLENLSHQEPAQALTGTFKRGDLTTARLHLDAIASERLTDALKAYLILGDRSLKLSDISPDKKVAIRKLLKQAAKLSGRH
jgi:predicted short-subunit dehydrogenase-like oxidoreductase (DUF2520 family)